MQILVIGFEGNHFTGEILPELRRLQDEDVLKVVDLLVVVKDKIGDVRAVELSGLDERERMELGALAGLEAVGEDGVERGAVAEALSMADGVFDERDIWAVEEAIPPDSAAAIAILEHLWAIPFRDAVVRAGGVALADAWVHPQDLVAAGAEIPSRVRAEASSRPIGLSACRRA